MKPCSGAAICFYSNRSGFFCLLPRLHKSTLLYFLGRSAPLPRSCSWNALFIERNLQKPQILRGNKTNKGHSFRNGVPFKWSKQKSVCGISVVKREIAAVFHCGDFHFGGPNRDRTDDLTDANQPLKLFPSISARFYPFSLRPSSSLDLLGHTVSVWSGAVCGMFCGQKRSPALAGAFRR